MNETAQTTEQDLQDAISAAEKRVTDLIQQIEGLAAAEHEAVQRSDAAGVRAVQQRRDDLLAELRHAKADVQDALADLEAHRAMLNADDPEQLTRLELLLAVRQKIDGEVRREQTEIGSKRTRRDRYIGQQTEHRHKAEMYRRDGIEWG